MNQPNNLHRDFLLSKLMNDIEWVSDLEDIVNRWNNNNYLIEIKPDHFVDINHDVVKYLADTYPNIDPNTSKIAGAICYFFCQSLPLTIKFIPVNKNNNKDDRYIIKESVA